MITIIAGSRSITDYNLLDGAILQAYREGIVITEIVSGGARGADQLGERRAKDNSIPLKIFYPNWVSFGKSAGFIRNTEMAEYAEALIALWDGKSKGTKHMIDTANKHDLLVYVHPCY